MKRMLCGFALLFAISVFAQQQSIAPYNSPPTTTPPTFPQDQRPGEALPPDTRAPAPMQPTDAEVHEQIEHKLATEPLLEHLPLRATVNKDTIVLTGTVNNEQQHRLARRVAESYAGQRQIIDKIKIRG
jgi:hypothetical protein